jgi:hypothetical protein
MVAAGWSEAQKRAYVLADNQLAITGSRFKLQGAGQARRSPNLCIVSEIHSRSLRQRLKNWSETLREDRNGKSTGTDAKAACARKGNDRPPRPGRVQAEAA